MYVILKIKDGEKRSSDLRDSVIKTATKGAQKRNMPVALTEPSRYKYFLSVERAGVCILEKIPLSRGGNII